MTVEKDTEDSTCYEALHGDPTMQRLLNEHSDLFTLQSNTWMPFHAAAKNRGFQVARAIVDKPCDQVLKNVVVTPFGQVSGCCGLTFEYIPEMKLGALGRQSLRDMFLSQLEDFLKIWIHMDGPYEIIRKLFGDAEVTRGLANVSHICQACVILHQNPNVRAALIARWHEFVPEVIHRYNIATALRRKMAEKAA
ncbi:MAG: SPASM domain-containing protein [Pseudomonadota bacterium]